MRKILLKDLRREIFKSFSRFFSIALLLAIGTTFFIGLRSTPSNMLITADHYFKSHAFFDLRIQTNDRITEKERAEIEDLANISYAERKHIIQTIIQEKNLVIEIESYAPKLFEFVKGRAPEKANEIVIDKKAEKYFKLGDRLTFSEDSEETSDLLAEEAFEIVGFVNYYRYFSKNDRGVSAVGNGELTFFGAVNDEAFSRDDYNCLDIHVNRKWREADLYSSKYLNKLDRIAESVSDLQKSQQKQRKSELLTDIEEQEKEFDETESTLKSSKDEMNQQLENAKALLKEQEGTPFLPQTEQTISDIEAQLQKIEKQEKELQDSAKKFDDQREAVADIEGQLIKIDQTISFVPFKENINRMKALGNSIPFIFFFVASLVTAVIISRMIEQEKKQIGTLKALGVSNQLIVSKYRWYTTVSGISGLLLGIYLGVFQFPQLLISLYSSMYVLKDYHIGIYWYLLLSALIISVICIVLIPFIIYTKLLSNSALELMRGQTPKKGRKIILERFPMFWNLLPFNFKMNLRIMARYKYRMTLLTIGIIGCTCLLIIGFGGRNSVSRLIDSQFGKVLQYDLAVYQKSGVTESEKKEYESFLDEKKDLDRLSTIQEKCTVQSDKNTYELTLISPLKEEAERLNQFIRLTDHETQKKLQLQSGEVFLTNKLAQMLNVAENETISVKLSEGQKRNFKISHITDNYVMNYLYVATDIYQKEASEEALNKNQVDLLQYAQLSKKESTELVALPAVTRILRISQEKKRALEVTEQLNSLILVIIVSSALLGLIVVYNLAYINALERNQEMAVLFVMGYRHKELTLYIFREIFSLGILAVLLGSLAGFIGHKILLGQIELDNLSFPEVQKIPVLFYTILVLMLITLILYWLMYFKIKEMNVIASLKDRE